MNGKGLSNLVLTMNEIWNIGELETELELVSLVPVLETIVELLVKVHSTIFELVSDVGSESPDSPVTQHRLARNIYASVSHELGFYVVDCESCLLFEICDVSRENSAIYYLREVGVDLVLCKILSLVVLVFGTGELQVDSLAIL